MESGIVGHFVTRFSLSRTRLHRGKRPPLQNGMVEIFIERLFDCRQKLQTRGCAGELRCRGRSGIHEEYGEFLRKE